MGFIDTFNRIRLETDLQTQDQLARFLGIKQGSVSGAKKRGQFPRAWVEKIGKHYGLRYEWIMEGAEPKFSGKTKKTEPLPAPGTAEAIRDILPPGMNRKEVDEVFDRLRYILQMAPDAERYKVRGVIDEVYQKIK